MVFLFGGCLAVGFALFSGGPVTSGLCDLFYELPPNSYFILHKTTPQLSGRGSQNWLRFAKPKVLLSNPLGLRASEMSDWITGWQVPYGSVYELSQNVFQECPIASEDSWAERQMRCPKRAPGPHHWSKTGAQRRHCQPRVGAFRFCGAPPHPPALPAEAQRRPSLMLPPRVPAPRRALTPTRGHRRRPCWDRRCHPCRGPRAGGSLPPGWGCAAPSRCRPPMPALAGEGTEQVRVSNRYGYRTHRLTADRRRHRRRHRRHPPAPARRALRGVRQQVALQGTARERDRGNGAGWGWVGWDGTGWNGTECGGME